MDNEAGQVERKKHRHELGQEDHGAVTLAETTGGIQKLMLLWIGLTFALVAYAIIAAVAASS